MKKVVSKMKREDEENVNIEQEEKEKERKYLGLIFSILVGLVLIILYIGKTFYTVFFGVSDLEDYISNLIYIAFPIWIVINSVICSRVIFKRGVKCLILNIFIIFISFVIYFNFVSQTEYIILQQYLFKN